MRFQIFGSVSSLGFKPGLKFQIRVSSIWVKVSNKLFKVSLLKKGYKPRVRFQMRVLNIWQHFKLGFQTRIKMSNEVFKYGLQFQT